MFYRRQDGSLVNLGGARVIYAHNLFEDNRDKEDGWVVAAEWEKHAAPIALETGLTWKHADQLLRVIIYTLEQHGIRILFTPP